MIGEIFCFKCGTAIQDFEEDKDGQIIGSCDFCDITFQIDELEN